MTSSAQNPTVELQGITKSFSGIKALDGVSLKAFAGQCLGLVGENGAGKSTLMKILSGVWPAGSYGGKISIDGKPFSFDGPGSAAAAGIAIIHQELSLFEELTVAENIFASKFPHSWGVIHHQKLLDQTQEILDRLHFTIHPTDLVKDLSVGQRQLVEIARAFTRTVKVLIFDEPTSALTDREIDRLFGIIKDLKEQGVACIYISHKFPEIYELCDRITVIRDGLSICDIERQDLTDEKMIEAMVGRKIASVFPPKRDFDPEREKLLEVRDLTYVTNDKSQRIILKDISFDLKRGEILGIAGLMGSKRTELLMALFGALKGQRVSGEILIDGKVVDISCPKAAIQAGLGLVTEDRKLSGLVLEMDVKSNLTLPIVRRLSRFMTIRTAEESKLVQYYMRVLRIKTPNEDFKVRHLSGGNQQKVILGRWLSTQPKILLLDEPTRGIDVSAKAEIYYLMRQLVDQGLTLILVSSELPEVVSLSDRVIVMREGRIAGVLEADQITQKRIMERAAA